MTRARARATVLRSAAVAALALLASGVPNIFLAAAGAEVECGSDCDGSLAGRQCPPNCTSGSCARIVLSVLATPVEMPPPAGQPARLVPEDPARLPHGKAPGVFHPPRA